MITLKTLPKATKQEVFDQVYTHLLTQNKRSQEPVNLGTCLYRGNAGLKCAAGCLIGDDEYKKTFEGRTWSSLRGSGLVPAEHSQLIIELQRIHDSRSITDWPNELDRLAEIYNLTVPKINT